MPVGYVLIKDDAKYNYALLRQYSDWGLEAVDLATPPRRFWADSETADAPVEVGVEAGSVKTIPKDRNQRSAEPSVKGVCPAQ